jgi:hypothetical protein
VSRVYGLAQFVQPELVDAGHGAGVATDGAHLSRQALATIGLLITVASSVWLSTDGREAHFASDILPGLSALGLGIGMMFVPVSLTSVAGIPASHAGVASGFLMTGREIGAALGVANLSALASSAGSLVTVAGATDAFLARFNRHARAVR